MFGADALCVLTLAIEDKSQSHRVVCRGFIFLRRILLILFLSFRSIGDVFSLTTEGHIDVGIIKLEKLN
jgi:hypothetical protein